jgi:transcriptional regulator with XRE-family HTH domain
MKCARLGGAGRSRRKVVTVNDNAPLVDLALGARLRLLRLKRGLSAADVSRLTGMSLQALQEVENGARRLMTDDLFHITGALQIAPHHLLAALTDPHRLQQLPARN